MKPSRELVSKLLGVSITAERMIRRASADYRYSGWIQRVGDPVEEVLLVLDGKIRAEYVVPGEAPLVVDYEKGSVVGSIECLAHIPAMSSWRAMDASFVRVKCDGFLWLCANLKSQGRHALRQRVDDLHQSPLMRPFYELLIRQRTGHASRVVKVSSHQVDDAPFVGAKGIRPIVVGGELVVARRDRPSVTIARVFPDIRLGVDPFKMIGAAMEDLIFTVSVRTELAWIEDSTVCGASTSEAEDFQQGTGDSSDFWNLDGLDPEFFFDSREITRGDAVTTGNVPKFIA
jgi:hypothetical protein